jgi:Amt family ammonium transporter
MGGVSLMSQLIGTALGITIAFVGGYIIYGIIKALIGIRLSAEEEQQGADLSIHKISSTADD